jgi:hypothetical protein
VSVNTVKPEETCSIRDIHLSGAGISLGPASQFAMKKPVHRLKMMNAAIVQCRTIATRE